VTILDTGGDLPEVPAFGPYADGGRGIPFIEDVAKTWGSERLRPGRAVWFEVGG
jgi:hypothetical protein